MFVAVGRERGTFSLGSGAELALAIRTSRTYVRTAQGWRQLHHHGSIESPELLRDYQNAIAGMNP